MKYILISILLIVSLVFTSCSLLEQYTPALTNETGNNTLILNEFNFTNGQGENSTLVVTNETQNANEIENESLLANESSQETIQKNVTAGEGVVLTTVTATEGDLVSLASLVAKDPDGDKISYIYSKPFNDVGLWQTNDGDAGKYLSSITATDGVLSTTEQIQVVIKPSNKAPVIDCPDYFIVSEGDLIDLPCTIYDEEGDEVTFAVSGFMNELTHQTNYGDAGEYSVVITATDGKKSAIHKIDLIINKKNRKPVVEAIPPIHVTELDTVTLHVIASDPDGDNLTVTYPTPFDENGVWKTTRGVAGVYDFDVVVSDGTDDVHTSVQVNVSAINLAPIVQPIAPITVKEGETIVLPVNATDSDGDNLTISYSGLMTSKTYTTTFEDAGEYVEKITVSDGEHEVTISVPITVENVNRPPVFI